MKKQWSAVAAFVLLTGVMLWSGCSSETKEDSSKDKKDTVSQISEQSDESQQYANGTGVSYRVTDAEKPTPSSGTVKTPLTNGSWGTAAKYCLEESRYVNVPVRVVSVRRGTRVTEEVRSLMNRKGDYFTEPSDQEEYAIVEYEISLDGFPVGKGGVLCDIVAFVTGEDGEAMRLDSGSYWGSTALALDDDTYYYEGVIHSQLAYRIIKGRTDYLLMVGEYGETQTCFRPE